MTALDSWRSRPVAQRPNWPDADALNRVSNELATYPPLVVPEECDRLRDRLAEVARGEAFLLQGGDCAETFVDTTLEKVRDKMKILLQMAVVLTYGASVPVVKVGRMAGQYAKPRSKDVESIDGVELGSYRGDAVNSLERDPALRVPDPTRLIEAYHRSASTLNLMRAHASGGFADLRKVHAWNADFVHRSPAGQRYESIATDIDRALAFMQACGFDLDGADVAHRVELFASHEALLLDYEAPLTRWDDDRAAFYDLSGHLVWVGERTRDLDGAHI
jgi:3-deoxy-7-phosphoheptulonate synthase